MKPHFVRAGAATLFALSLAGCIDSAEPIIPDSQPVLGTTLKLQLYSLRKGYATEPERADYVWNGGIYKFTGGSMKDVAGFSVHPFESGNLIIQTVPGKPGQKTEYALVRKLAEGVYLVNAIDEADADEATRASFCKKTDRSGCQIQTTEQLLAFARATAARQKEEGGLALRLPDSAPKARRARGVRRR